MTRPISKHSDWRLLFRIACDLIDQVNSEQRIISRWTLGGGTAMMIQINHRESHDIDIFVDDPQILAYLNPSTNEFRYEKMPTEYSGDGSRFLKFSFEEIGEIDFIVAAELTSFLSTQQNIENRQFSLETVPEVITKKIYHRGANITPRDIFDIAAAAQSQKQDIISALQDYPDRVEATLKRLNKLNPEFIEKTIAQLMIQDDFKDVAENALGETKNILRLITS